MPLTAGRKQTNILLKIFIVPACCFLFLLKPVQGQTVPASSSPAKPGVIENLGGNIPLDLFFVDEKGGNIRLGDLLNKPTLLLPVYFHCPNACPLLLANLASAINGIISSPGKDYQVIALSFDDHDTPALALEAKSNYLPASPEAKLNIPEN